MYVKSSLNRFFIIAASALILQVCTGLCFAQSETAQNPALQSEFERVHDQIVTTRDAGIDVPAELYDRYFELLGILYPASVGRSGSGTLDERDGLDTCPGYLIVQPPTGQLLNYVDNGTTDDADVHNDCPFPRGGKGPDLFYRLEMNHPEWLLISTCGSAFDSYLAVFKDTCCTPTGTNQPILVNQDNPRICGARTVNAALSSCFLLPGTYYIVLDGGTYTGKGDYYFNVRSVPDSSCEVPPPPPECTPGYLPHNEVEHPNEEVCETAVSVNCGDGYCGTIDFLGDRDVYVFTLTECKTVTLSAFADDTPARSGYHNGLDPVLRLFSGPACDHPLYTNDDVGTAYTDILGTDARIITHALQPATYYLEITGKTLGKYEFLITCQNCPSR